MVHHPERRPSRVAWLALLASLVYAVPAAAQATGLPDSTVTRWARAHAIALRPVDEPYQDSAFSFLGPLVGTARILALGEPVHGDHEPLVLRNHLIRYAVTHLGFTAVALESGFTEGTRVDGFVQGESGSLDDVVRQGFSWGFERLPENRDLVRWLREYNAQAPRKVHFYGIDLTGGDDVGVWPRGSQAPIAALRYLEQVAPATATGLNQRLVPLLDRFLPSRYPEYSPTERNQLRALLDTLYQALVTDSGRYIRMSSRHSHALGLRNAWTAVRLNDVLSVSSPEDSPAGEVLRDSSMAENTRWALDQEGESGRVLLFAHDAHVMNKPFIYPKPPYAGPRKMEGQYLRAWYGGNLVVVASAVARIAGRVNGGTGWREGIEETPSDPTTFTAALATVNLPLFVLDLRAGDRVPAIRTALARAWPFQLLVGSQSFSPRDAFDAMVFFNRVTASKLLQ